MRDIDYSLSKNIPYDLMVSLRALPIKDEALFIFVAICDSSSSKENISTKLSMYFKKPLSLVVVDEDELEQAFFELGHNQQALELANKALSQIDYKDSNASIELLDFILGFAINRGSSDIHLETTSLGLVIRFRIDGILKPFFKLPYEVYPVLSSIIKILANLDISQRRLPQNGRISKRVEDKNFDLRISFMPIIDGESIVVRILNKVSVQKSLARLGFCDADLDRVKTILHSNEGLVLLTGPTGSGKTTTLYSMLRELKGRDKKIITIEDPVEYKIDGLQQVSINEDIGLTFHEVLKNILRQDPDVIMIGEIRDKKSLQVALQASLTGHLVLATLHTSDAPNAITRLIDLGGERFLLASTLKMVISQRLVRKVCVHCDNAGCKECSFTGFKDRVLVYESIENDGEISSKILEAKPISDIVDYATNKGYRTLKERAQELIIQNVTTRLEISRAIL
jgi:general secretion pathway protein E